MKSNEAQKIIKRHSAMVQDSSRTPLIKKAIHKLVKPGATVFDLGCGTGVLTQMALEAGAQKIYACDVEEAVNLARWQIQSKDNKNRVTFFKGLSSEISLPEKVDVLIAEVVGSLGLNENILPSVIDARKRFLKKGGKIIPEGLKIYLAPIELKQISHKSKKSNRNHIHEMPFMIDFINPSQILSGEKKYCDLLFLKENHYGYDQEINFIIERPGILGGFCGWIEITWAPGIVTKTSPFDPPTHWKQTILPLSRTYSVDKGDRVLFRLRIYPKEKLFSGESVVEWGYKIE